MSGQRVDVKVVMLGKEYVGKTSLVERYVHDRFLVGPYQNVSAPRGAGHGGEGASPHRGPEPFALVADHRGRLRGQGDVRRRPDGDFGYLGKSRGQVVLGKPIPEEVLPITDLWLPRGRFSSLNPSLKVGVWRTWGVSSGTQARAEPPPALQDTAGSERYEAMSRIYYRGAKAAIVCYGKEGSDLFPQTRRGR